MFHTGCVTRTPQESNAQSTTFSVTHDASSLEGNSLCTMQPFLERASPCEFVCRRREPSPGSLPPSPATSRSRPSPESAANTRQTSISERALPVIQRPQLFETQKRCVGVCVCVCVCAGLCARILLCFVSTGHKEGDSGVPSPGGGRERQT